MRSTHKMFIGLALAVAALVASPVRTTRAEEAAPLPTYFSGANADPATPTWPDPTAFHLFCLSTQVSTAA